MNPQYPGQGYQQPGAPQQPTTTSSQAVYPPQQSPASTPQVPTGKGGFALGPPSGPAKLLWIGLVMMIVAFAFKQIIVDWSLTNTGNLIQKEKVEAKQAVEIAEIDAALEPIDGEIDELQAKLAKPAKTDEDEDDKDKGSDKQSEKLAKLKKDRDKQNAALEEKRTAVRQKYKGLLRDARRSQTNAIASGIGTVQMALFAKLFLDLLKIGGAAICVLSGLRISADPEQSSGLKVYAAVIGGAAFLSVVVGGLAALLG